MYLYKFERKEVTSYIDYFYFWCDSNEEALRVLSKIKCFKYMELDNYPWKLFRAKERLIITTYIEWELIKENKISFDETLKAYDEAMRKIYPKYKGRKEQCLY